MSVVLTIMATFLYQSRGHTMNLWSYRFSIVLQHKCYSMSCIIQLLFNGGFVNSKQQETAKQASSGSVTPGTLSQPSPPLPQSTMSSATATSSSTDMKSAGLADIKDEPKTPGLASLSSGNLTSTSSGFGFNVSLDKEEAKVCSSIYLIHVNNYLD